MVAMGEDEYKELVKAKGRMEMESGIDLTIGQAIAIAAAGVLTGAAIAVLVERWLTEKEE